MITERQAPLNLLEEISAFCKTERIAESTFGKRAVNDGKFVARLKDGARVTPETWDRVTEFLEKNGWQTLQPPEPESLHLLSVDGGSSKAVIEGAKTGNGSQGTDKLTILRLRSGSALPLSASNCARNGASGP